MNTTYCKTYFNVNKRFKNCSCWLEKVNKYWHRFGVNRTKWEANFTYTVFIVLGIETASSVDNNLYYTYYPNKENNVISLVINVY